MTVTGLALRMRTELAALTVRHGFAARPHIIPLRAPADGAQFRRHRRRRQHRQRAPAISPLRDHAAIDGPAAKSRCFSGTTPARSRATSPT